ncbi:MAG: hypothetical protein ACM3JJ_06245 [Hyphomicrobiales bacterium]
MHLAWHLRRPHWPGRAESLSYALAVSLLALTGAAPAPPAATPDPPDTAGAIGSRHGWIVSLAEPCRDTLDAPAPDVVQAAERCLEADDWHVDTRDRDRGDLVTRWKELKHPLARILMGHVEARCAVAVRPIEDGRTMVVFQGAIASRETLEGNPAYRLAMKQYRNAAHGWQREVRGDLALHHRLGGGTP